jgi:hypothetical protein
MALKQVITTVFEGKDKVSDDINRINKKMTVMEKQGAAVKKAYLGIAAGAAVVVTGLGALVHSVATGADELGKMAAQLGVTSDWLSQMAFAADRAGIKQRELTIALQRMGRRAGEAAGGAGEAMGAFNELGIVLKTSSGRLRSIDELLPDIADGLAKVTDQNDRLRLAQKIFDSEGVKMIRVLQGGADAMAALRLEADLTGRTLSDTDTKAAAKFNDQITNLTSTFEGLKQEIVIGLLPALTDMATGLTTVLRAGRTFKEWIESLEPEFKEARTEAEALTRAGEDLLAGMGERRGGATAPGEYRYTPASGLPLTTPTAIPEEVLHVAELPENAQIEQALWNEELEKTVNLTRDLAVGTTEAGWSMRQYAENAPGVEELRMNIVGTSLSLSNMASTFERWVSW